MRRIDLKKIISMSLATMVFASIVNTYALAEENLLKTTYVNNNILTSDSDIIANAKYDASVASVYNENDNKMYYEDGKLYEMKCDTPKSIVQKVRTTESVDNQISEEYVADIVLTGDLTTYDVDEEYRDELINGTYYSRAVTNSITKNKETEDSSVMGIRYTVYYKTIDVSGGTAIAISHAYGKVVHCDTGSGVYPEEMNFYANISAGGAYDQYGNYLGLYNPSTPSQTIYSPSVGESAAYLYTINNFDEYFYIGGDAFMAGTNLVVTATRGVELEINVDLSNE